MPDRLPTVCFECVLVLGYICCRACLIMYQYLMNAIFTSRKKAELSSSHMIASSPIVQPRLPDMDTADKTDKPARAQQIILGIKAVDPLYRPFCICIVFIDCSKWPKKQLPRSSRLRPL